MSIYPVSFGKTPEGEFSIGNVSVGDLAQKFGTPLYVLDYETIRSNVLSYSQALTNHYPSYQLIYAGKANLTVGLINVLAELGMNLDVVSGGELYTALKSNLKSSQVFFHGNNKLHDELKLAVENNVTIVVDNNTELSRIFEISQNLGKEVDILVRVKPGIEAHTHEYIKTGQEDSKFGVSIDEFFGMAERVSQQKLVNLVGIHSHIGSQIFSIEPFLDLIDIQCDLIKKVKNNYGITIEKLNIGGGIGIKYTEEDAPPVISDFIEKVSQKIKVTVQELGLSEPQLLLEPGRSIIGNAGVTIYSIGTIKQVTKDKTFLFVDGGMADNPRPMMYQSVYTFSLGHESVAEKAFFSIAGKYCESGDVIGENVFLPRPNIDDKLMVFGTGAYNYSMASNYNRACRPAVVLVREGQSSVMVERERFEDLLARDRY